MAPGFTMVLLCELQVEIHNVFLPVLAGKRYILQPIARHKLAIVQN